MKTEDDSRQMIMKRCMLRGTNVRYCYSGSGIVFRQTIMKVSSKSLDYLQIFFSNSKVG